MLLRLRVKTFQFICLFPLWFVLPTNLKRNLFKSSPVPLSTKGTNNPHYTIKQISLFEVLLFHILFLSLLLWNNTAPRHHFTGSHALGFIPTMRQKSLCSLQMTSFGHSVIVDQSSWRHCQWSQWHKNTQEPQGILGNSLPWCFRWAHLDSPDTDDSFDNFLFPQTFQMKKITSTCIVPSSVSF